MKKSFQFSEAHDHLMARDAKSVLGGNDLGRSLTGRLGRPPKACRGLSGD